MAAFIKWLGVGVGLISISVSALTLEQQRQKYEQAQELITDNKIEQYQNIRKQLDSYPLTPYLDYRTFITDLSSKSPAEIESYIQKNHEYPFSRSIRGHYLDALVKAEDWDGFYRFQANKPRMQSYQCSYYFARHQVGKKEEAYQGAADLWLNGGSVAKECDDLFELWDEAGLRKDELILQRMGLAFSSRNGQLLNYLKDLPKSEQARKNAVAIYNVNKDKSKVAEFASEQPKNKTNKQVAIFAIKRLAYQGDNPQLAIELLPKVSQFQGFSDKEYQDTADYIAYSLINSDDADLVRWRDATLFNSSNSKWLERRARLAIQQQDWTGLEKWITKLPESNKSSKRWQYWLGRSEIAQGNIEQGKTRLRKLLGHRNFYSIAAADYFDEPFQYSSSVLADNSASIEPFTRSLARIKELIAVDKITAAKTEWNWLLIRANSEQQRALAQYAAKQRWHHLTVTATIEAGMWDHLSLRFPVAHQWWFNFYAKKFDIDPITLMALARQESALDIDAKSPVGARGLMQIMPKTASYTAKKYDIDYNGAEELFNVGKNIEIGSRYFAGLLDEYQGNRLLAFGAYNAGPHRVALWRERTGGKVDAYSYIEAIPFSETRGYIQNILMFEVYYRDILGIKGDFLSDLEAEMKY